MSARLTSSLSTRRRLRVALLASFAVALASGGPTSTFAAQSAIAGKNTCMVIALTPTLAKTSLTGRASVTCTQSTTVTLEMGVVELDGTAEDAKVPIPVSAKSVAVAAKQTVTVTTKTVTCVNTESGNEEYASKVRVNISGTVSAFDRFAPSNDSFAC